MEFLRADGVTIATVEVEINGDTFKGIGGAKKHPTDPNIEEVGDLVAASRAVRDLAKKISEAAKEAQKPHDQMQDEINALWRRMKNVQQFYSSQYPYPTYTVNDGFPQWRPVDRYSLYR